LLCSPRIRLKLALIIVPCSILVAVAAPVVVKSTGPGSLLATPIVVILFSDGARLRIAVVRDITAGMATDTTVRPVLVRVSEAVDMIIEAQLFIQMRWSIVSVQDQPTELG
jgi:hypothetical protein